MMELENCLYNDVKKRSNGVLLTPNSNFVCDVEAVVA